MLWLVRDRAVHEHRVASRGMNRACAVWSHKQNKSLHSKMCCLLYIVEDVLTALHWLKMFCLLYIVEDVLSALHLLKMCCLLYFVEDVLSALHWLKMCCLLYIG